MPAIMPEGFSGHKREFVEDRWDDIYRAMRAGTVLTEKVSGVEKVEGREHLVVRLGNVKGLIGPEDLGPHPRRLAVMVGLPVSFKVKAVDRENGLVYLSRTEAIEADLAAAREALERDAAVLAEIQEEYIELRRRLKEGTGDEEARRIAARLGELRRRAREAGPVRTATVRWVERWGGYVDIGGGLLARLPAREIGHGFVDDARTRLSPGDAFDVKIIAVTERAIVASLAAMLPDPWEGAEKRYRTGGLYGGRVTRKLAERGVLLVELEPGIEASVPLPPFDEVPPGAEVVVLVSRVDPEKKRIRGVVARVQKLPPVA
jgi:ribosomal protein S1